MNKAILGAMRKGIAARAAGALRSSCPYHDVRRLDGRLTWGRAFRRAWFDGFDGKLTETDKRALTARPQSLVDRAEAYAKRAGVPSGMEAVYYRVQAAIVLAYAAGFRAGRRRGTRT